MPYFDNEHKIVPDCCDLCNPDISAVPWAPRFISNDGVSIRRRTGLSFSLSEKKVLKRILLEWREKAFKKSLRPICPFYPEECVIPDDIVEKCLKEAGKILLEPRSVTSILGWCPMVKDHPDEVVDILHKFVPSTRPAPPDFTQPEEIDLSETPYQATNYVSALLSGKTPLQAASSPSTLPSTENSFHIVNFPPTLPPDGNPSQASSPSSTLPPNIVLTDVMDVDKPRPPDTEGLPNPPSLGPAKRTLVKKNADKGPPKKIKFVECSTSSTFQKKNLYR
ncbi:hypothetical protein BGX20_006036 [Mortierella sp. AD010]|nr:hypothetical protein BGX20_006036 [Mortierella sp. AD010]